MTVENSYSLLRFITWAIPILGFLGTVVGITGAIQNVNPESLSSNDGLSGVTSGLSTAFNATALALSLTMVLMFISFLVERLEQGVLEQVDRYVDLQLTHRFERTGAESGRFVEALKQNTQVLVKAMEQMVERQADVWSRSMEKADRLFNETGKHQQELMGAALLDALETTMNSHTQALAEMEKRMLARSQEVFAGIVERTQSMYDGLSGPGRRAARDGPAAPGKPERIFRADRRANAESDEAAGGRNPAGAHAGTAPAEPDYPGRGRLFRAGRAEFDRGHSFDDHEDPRRESRRCRSAHRQSRGVDSHWSRESRLSPRERTFFRGAKDDLRPGRARNRE